MNLPIISITIDQMKHTIKTALSEHSIQLDEMVNKSITEYCNSGQLQDYITNVTESTINDIIQKEIQSYFSYGEGRQILSDAVKTSIKHALKGQ